MLNKRLIRLLMPLAVAATPVGGAAAQDTVKIGMVMPLDGQPCIGRPAGCRRGRLYMGQHGNTWRGGKSSSLSRTMRPHLKSAGALFSKLLPMTRSI
jgi:hypothetical protein